MEILVKPEKNSRGLRYLKIKNSRNGIRFKKRNKIILKYMETHYQVIKYNCIFAGESEGIQNNPLWRI